jgi:hypothetical protein
LVGWTANWQCKRKGVRESENFRESGERSGMLMKIIENEPFNTSISSNLYTANPACTKVLQGKKIYKIGTTSHITFDLDMPDKRPK